MTNVNRILRHISMQFKTLYLRFYEKVRLAFDCEFCNVFIGGSASKLYQSQILGYMNLSWGQ